jgi:hypothetical protein
MKTLACIALGLSTAAVMFAGAYLAHLGARPGVRGDSVGFEASDETERVTADLECQRQVLLSRLTAKLDITRAVIQRRLSLLEAAREMRELIANDSRSLSWLRDLFGGCSDEELFCRHVIAMVQNNGPLLEPPTFAAEVARLETELQEHLRRGTLHFPNKSPQPILFQIY